MAEPARRGSVNGGGGAPGPEDEAGRRRRIRNWALLAALVALAVLFFAIAVVRMSQSHHLPYFR